MSDLLSLYMNIDSARSALKFAIERSYAVGAPISWLGASSVITGTVVRHDFDDNLQVHNPKTGKTYRIYYYQIVPEHADTSLLFLACQEKVSVIRETLHALKHDDAINAVAKQP